MKSNFLLGTLKVLCIYGKALIDKHCQLYLNQRNVYSRKKKKRESWVNQKKDAITSLLDFLLPLKMGFFPKITPIIFSKNFISNRAQRQEMVLNRVFHHPAAASTSLSNINYVVIFFGIHYVKKINDASSLRGTDVKQMFV